MLALGYDELLAEAAHKLGWGRDAEKWGATKTATLDALVQTALRMVYHPHVTLGKGTPHAWSWLKVPFQLTTAVAKYDYDLPFDFGFFEGPMTIRSSSSLYAEVEPTGEGEIRRLRSTQSSSSGTPRLYAFRPRAADAIQPQQFELLLWPTPDAALTLECRVSVNTAWKLSKARPYPYGTAAHAELYKAAILAAAEQELDDVRGPQWQHFMEQLQAAIAFDLRQQPQSLGFMQVGGERYIRRNDRGILRRNGTEIG